MCCAWALHSDTWVHAALCQQCTAICLPAYGHAAPHVSSCHAQVVVEERQQGTIRSRVVADYVSAVGLHLSVVVLLSLAAMQLSRNGSDWWLSQWSADVQGTSAGPGSAWIRHKTRYGRWFPVA